MNCFVHSLGQCVQIKHVLVNTHHGVEVIHGGVRRVELIVHHIKLLGSQRVLSGESPLVLFVRRLTVIFLQHLGIKLCDLFRCPPAKYHCGVQPGQITLAYQVD